MSKALVWYKTCHQGTRITTDEEEEDVAAKLEEVSRKHSISALADGDKKPSAEAEADDDDEEEEGVKRIYRQLKSHSTWADTLSRWEGSTATLQGHHHISYSLGLRRV